MLDDGINKILEYTLVGGAFIYLLLFVTKSISTALSDTANKNQVIAESLVRVTDTLMRMDVRMEQMERRMERIERGGVEIV